MFRMSVVPNRSRQVLPCPSPGVSTGPNQTIHVVASKECQESDHLGSSSRAYHINQLLKRHARSCLLWLIREIARYS